MPTTSRSTPLLSILVPAYNAQAFIAPCLETIAAQMDTRHELVVIDDGSRDATAALAAQVQAAHPALAIRIVSQANAGIAGARNRALAEARGDYVQWVDADDLLLPGALAAIGAALEAQRPDVVACAFRMWRPDRGHATRTVSLGYPAGVVCTDRDLILRTFFADRHMYVWANVIRRALYLAAPQPVFPAGRLFEDVSVLACLLGRSASLVYLPAPILDYRQHPCSLTKSVSAAWCRDFIEALHQLHAHFAQHGASPALRLQIDVAACHFYIGVVKSSYQLPLREGRVRQVKRLRRRAAQAA